MEQIKVFLWEYRYIIIVALAAIVYCIFEWQKVKNLAYQLMLLAKSKAKDAVLNSGEEQENYVVDHLYELLPGRVTLFLSKDSLRPIVRKLYHAAKDILDNGKFDNSIQ